MFMLVWIVAILCLAIIVWLLTSDNSNSPVEARLQQVAQDTPNASYLRTDAGIVVPPSAPQIDNAAMRQARAEQRKSTLRERLTQAGLYKERSSAFFAIIRLVLALVPIGVGIATGVMGLAPLLIAVVLGAILSALGTIAPSFWLDYLKAQRQRRILQALPDALDVIVVCLEGGLSLSSSFTRVARELSDAHPLLANELRIVERETQMGRTTGEAMRNFAARFDLAELRSMASVITQAERFGTSVVKALTVYADTMRVKRQQVAEERAHKAVVKIIFPTVLFIFPAIFVVILGPAVIQIFEAFEKTGVGNATGL